MPSTSHATGPQPALRTVLHGAACGLIAALALAWAGAAPARAFELKGPPKVAFLYAGDANDGGWDTTLEEGRKAVQASLSVQTAYSENIPEDAAKLRSAIDLYVKRGFNIIVGTSFGYSAPLAEAAKAYPNVAFLNAAGTTNGSNLESFYARTYQAWYLAGILAGATSKTNKVGMLGGYPVSVVNWDINGFIRGAQSVNPHIQGVAVFTNSWWDPAKEGQVSDAILDQKADVVATDLTASSALVAAEKRGARSIGFQVNMAPAAPTGILTSVVFHWDRYLVPTIKSIVGGTWHPQPYGAFVGMESGVVDLAPLGPAVTPGLTAKVDQAKASIIAGTLDPFAGPLKKQNGEAVLAAGAKLDDGALWQMNYFVQGVTGTMPGNGQ